MFPTYTVATYPDYVESEVNLIKDYMFYKAEETTCRIESYILVCDAENNINDGGNVIISNTEIDPEYVIHVDSSSRIFSYVFTETELIYTIAGLPVTSDTYAELDVSDLDFESLRNSYTDDTYEPMITLVTNHYELHKTLITTVNVMIFVITAISTFVLILVLLMILIMISSRGTAKAGIGEKLRISNLITITCYSAIIPIMVMTILFLYTGSFVINLLFLTSSIMAIIALGSNRKV